MFISTSVNSEVQVFKNVKRIYVEMIITKQNLKGKGNV